MIFYPETAEQVARVVVSENGRIAIRGAGYSQGGHTHAVDGGAVIDMRRMRRIISIGADTVHVEAGCVWADVIEALNRVGRSPAEMQSYVNFSVGGAIGVNCHGRGMQFGSICDTILELEVVMADGSIRRTHPGKRLFSAIVGGYGLIAIVTSAVLRTVENVTMHNQVRIGRLDNIAATIRELRDDVVFYNGIIYPGVDKIYHKTWHRTSHPAATGPIAKPSTLSTLATLAGYQLMCRGGPLAKLLRGAFEPISHARKVYCSRNQEMWYDTKTITPLTTRYSRALLQEYFVPIDAINAFMPTLLKIMHDHHVNVINISVRAIVNRGDVRPLLDYAPEDRVAIVLFYNVWNGDVARARDQLWTRIAIAHVLAAGGTFYLPYAPYATKTQLETAYPNWNKFVDDKKHYDPDGRLMSKWFHAYDR